NRGGNDEAGLEQFLSLTILDTDLPATLAAGLSQRADTHEQNSLFAPTNSSLLEDGLHAAAAQTDVENFQRFGRIVDKLEAMLADRSATQFAEVRSGLWEAQLRPSHDGKGQQ